jgi:hypothetical protein
MYIYIYKEGDQANRNPQQQRHRMKNEITTRSRIALRWSTAPRHVGYANSNETNDLHETATSFTGTPRQIVAEMADIRRNVGQGTFLATHMTNNGRIVTMDEIQDVLDMIEYRKENR